MGPSPRDRSGPTLTLDRDRRSDRDWGRVSVGDFADTGWHPGCGSSCEESGTTTGATPLERASGLHRPGLDLRLPFDDLSHSLGVVGGESSQTGRGGKGRGGDFVGVEDSSRSSAANGGGRRAAPAVPPLRNHTVDWGPSLHVQCDVTPTRIEQQEAAHLREEAPEAPRQVFSSTL